jgi:uncharacterized protein YjiS (DUF1127 family)
MLLKLKIAVARRPALVSHIWSTIVAHLRARRQRARDLRAISHMNEHLLRDIGLSQSIYSSRDRAR